MIRLLDVNCRLGEGPAPREGAPRETEELLALMDDWRVEKALSITPRRSTRTRSWATRFLRTKPPGATGSCPSGRYCRDCGT